MTTVDSSTSADTMTKNRTSPNTWAGRAPSRLSGGGRRRSMPYLLLGVAAIALMLRAPLLVVVICAVAGTVVSRALLG